MDDSGPVFTTLLTGIFKTLENGDVSALLGLSFGLLGCLALSAICSSAENAFFSHRESDLEELRAQKGQAAKNILYLLASPKHLLATVLVVNSLGMVAFVVLSSFFIEMIMDIEHNPLLRFFIDAIVVTMIILVFGEVMPKVYATQHYRKSALFLGYPMRFFMFILWPFTNVLVKTTTFLEKRIRQKTPELTPEELSHAIDITANEADARQEKEILKGIVNITQTQVSQIMRPRMDVSALDDAMNFTEVLDELRKLRFSRMPVYHENFDQITGILNMKDLLPFLNEGPEFDWKKLQRSPHFVPENKKIDDLLHEFRQSRNHMAIVVDEFGGSKGIATLEDIMEEVFGEINDEFDEENQQYSRLGEHSYLFEGKTPLVDFLRITQMPVNYFDSVNEDIDTLGGLITEIAGKIPVAGEEIIHNQITFTIDAADMRRVHRVKADIKMEKPDDE